MSASRDQLEQTLRSQLAAVTSIESAWLFGSRARDTARDRSDVDLAVRFVDGRAPAVTTTLDLASALTLAIGLEVEVIDVERAPSDLVHRVLRDGRLLVERDRAARIAFEVAARNRYFDMAPLLREYRRLADGVP